MPRKCLIYYFNIVVILLLCHAAKAATYECDISPNESNNFLRAHFRLWLPLAKSNIRGLFIFIPGWNNSELNFCFLSEWQNLATKWQFGILATEWMGSMPEMQYFLAQNGSAKALQDAVALLAKKSGHDELRTARYAFCGYSAGGQFAYNFTCWNPKKTIAFVAIKGGFYDAVPNEMARKIPAMFIIGDMDEKYRIDNIQNLVTTQRQLGAIWIIAFDLHSGHEIGHSFDMARAFLDNVLKKEISK